MSKYAALIARINDSIKSDFDGHSQVLSGVLSDAIYFFYYGINYNDEPSVERAFAIVNYHIDTATNHILNYKFAHGLPGISWLLCFLQNNGLVPPSALENFDEVDAAIRHSLKWDQSDHTYDYTVGMLGKAQYFLERGDNPVAREALEEIILQLERDAIWENEASCAWLDYYTSVHNKSERKVIPFYNLGLGHGISSIVYFLCKFYKRGIKPDTCKKMIDGAINWLISKEEPGNHPFIYPNILYDGDDSGSDKYEIQGWCHGLLTNGLAFYYAGQTLQNSHYLAKYEAVIEASAFIQRRHISAATNSNLATRTSRIDLSFCHGIAGMVYMYDKLYLVTGNATCKRMSEYWTDQVLDKELVDLNLLELYNHGILGGLPGLALSLLQKDLTVNSKFYWDKALLLDLENF